MTVTIGTMTFLPNSTNDLGRTYSREEINLNIRYIYNRILSGVLTNSVAGHIPVSNF
jgi:hypothetical protein